MKLGIASVFHSKWDMISLVAMPVMPVTRIQMANTIISGYNCAAIA